MGRLRLVTVVLLLLFLSLPLRADTLMSGGSLVGAVAPLAAADRDRINQVFTQANQAAKRNDWATAAQLLKPISVDNALPGAVRSIASLRLARIDVQQHRYDEAIEIYSSVAANPAYPLDQRTEARECIENAQRLKSGSALPGVVDTPIVPPAAPVPAMTFWVAPTGNDKNPGTQASPFATLQAAIAAKRNNPGKTAIIELAPGYYRVSSTIALTHADCSLEQGALTIRAQQPGSVILYGGARLTGFQLVSDPAILARLPEEARGKVYQCDLKRLGINDYGTLTERRWAFQTTTSPTLEFFADGKPQTLARWPKSGFTMSNDVVQLGSDVDDLPVSFRYPDERPSRWVNAEDAWLAGYFLCRFADETMKIGKIDPVAHTITSATVGYGTEDVISYYAFNLLEEVGQPGDWYLNRKTGILYWYPAGDPNNTMAEISLLSSTMLKADSVDGLRLEGLHFDCARSYNAIETTRSSNCAFINCKITRMAGNGIVIDGGNNNLLLSCDLNTIGEAACRITGGNRQTLESSGDIIANCSFYDFGRIDRTYTPAIHIGAGSVGIRVVHNDFTHCPSAAIRIEGNDHMIEFNRFHDLLEEKNDEGIIDIWGNPTYRGIVFRYNIFENVGPEPAGLPINLRGAVRFDDIISGMLVYGNIFYRASLAGLGGVQINCGRDNVIDNNVFLDCKIGVSGGYGPRNGVWNGALPNGSGSRTTYIYNDLYMQRYPDLARVGDPAGSNYVWRNAFINCGSGASKKCDAIANTTETDDGAFIESGRLRDRIDDAAFDELGLRPIPYRQIGVIAK